MTQDQSAIDRVNRTADQARSSYDRMSRFYDLLAGRSERPHRQIGLNLLAAQPAERILEIGFGTGHTLLALARAVGDQGRVVGIDISPGMRRRTDKRLGKAQMAGRVELVSGDATQLPFETGPFDAVFSSFFLDLIDTPDIPRVLGECLRVLRVGGRCCMVSMSASGRQGAMSRLYRWAQRKFPRAVDCRPILLREAFEQAGLEVADSRLTSMWGLPVETVLGIRRG